MSARRDPPPSPSPPTSHPCSSTYLPGPAVGPSIVSSHHSGREVGQEGGDPAAGGWGDRRGRTQVRGAGISAGEGAGGTLGLGRNRILFYCMTLGEPSSSLGLSFPFWEMERIAPIWCVCPENKGDSAYKEFGERPDTEGIKGGWHVCECPGTPVPFILTPLPLLRPQRHGGVSMESIELQTVRAGSCVEQSRACAPQ